MLVTWFYFTSRDTEGFPVATSHRCVYATHPMLSNAANQPCLPRNPSPPTISQTPNSKSFNNFSLPTTMLALMTREGILLYSQRERIPPAYTTTSPIPRCSGLALRRRLTKGRRRRCCCCGVHSVMPATNISPSRKQSV